MNLTFYRVVRIACRFITFQCLREVVLHPERADRPGGLLLACTHVSHLEPIVVSSVLHRNVRWMSRIEFYRRWLGAAMLRLGGAFPVDRFGFTLPAVRRGIQLVRGGELVGVFPEGGVATGRKSMLRGGPMKHGVCTIAIWAGTPIVPVVILGTQKLNRVGPWLPFRRGRVYVAFGREVTPPSRRSGAGRSSRENRQILADRLRAEFETTYRELLSHTGLQESDLP